jgi:hypothetical protein
MTAQKTKKDGGTRREQLNLINLLLFLFQSKEIGLTIRATVPELLHVKTGADMAKSRVFAKFRFRGYISVCVSACIRSNPRT